MNRQTQPGLHFTRGPRDASARATPPDARAVKSAIDVQFEAGPDAAAAARNALLALCGHVDDEVLNDLRLLVSELVTNSVRHSELRPRDIVRMQARLTPTAIRVEVIDPGKGFHPQPREADRTRPGGWGLYLVDQLADRWGVVCNEFTRVWFELDSNRRRAGYGEAVA